MFPADHTCTILLVEDEAELRALLQVALESEGFRVRSVEDGRAALRLLHGTADTCLIVLDLELPTMDGRRFRAQQLRERSLAWIPVVVITGSDTTTGIAEGLWAHAVLRKPLDLDALRSTIEQVGCIHRGALARGARPGGATTRRSGTGSADEGLGIRDSGPGGSVEPGPPGKRDQVRQATTGTQEKTWKPD